MARFTIDRFENADWAVLEDERARTFSVPRGWLPTNAGEGDVLRASESPESSVSTVHFELDATTRDEQLANARARRDALPRGPKGDVSL